MDRVRKFRSDVITSMGCDPSTMDELGVTVAPDASREGSNVVAGYQLGERMYLSCDPAVEGLFVGAVGDMKPTLDGWRAMAEDLGGEFLRAARMQLLSDHELVVPPLPDGFAYRTIRSADAAGRDMVAELVSVSSEDDLDEAEIEMDDLDEVIDVVVDSAGKIAAYGSARLFDRATDFGDIGAMTREEYRGKGLGVAAITALCVRLLDEGVEPLYRCDEDNAGSRALSAKMGFEPATQLLGYRFGGE